MISWAVGYLNITMTVHAVMSLTIIGTLPVAISVPC
jgi:hypothetical protein